MKLAETVLGIRVYYLTIPEVIRGLTLSKVISTKYSLCLIKN